MNSPKPTRRTTRVAQTEAPVSTTAYIPTPEDSMLTRGDSLYIQPYQPRWGRLLFPHLYTNPEDCALTRAASRRLNLEVPKPEPTLPRAVPGFRHHIILMGEDDNDDLKHNFWDSFPAPLVSGPPNLPVRDNKRARDYDCVDDRNVRQRLCF